jgi:peptidoglycan hydrolase-like protein with peptidoglycan-binding domain
MNIVDAPGKITTGRPLKPFGIVVHHTASNKYANPDNVIAMCIRGVNKVPGPLYNYLIKGDGTIVKLTTSKIKANHAGRGLQSVLTRIQKNLPVLGNAENLGRITANSRFIGVSIINDGLGEKVPEVQMDALVDLCAFLCDGHKWNPGVSVIGHKEWTARKVDPSFSMPELRGMISRRMITDTPTMVLPKEPEDGRVLFPGTLRKGSRSQAVVHVQRRIGALADGIFGRGTLAKVKQWQRTKGLVADGVVGPKTWAAMQIRRQEIVEPAFY